MYFQRKFKDLLTVMGFDGSKKDDTEVSDLSLNEERLEKTRAQRTKMSVKRMHREAKVETIYRGRQKISNLFARRGIYLDI
jgi:regulator of PEP synthase PpsR (kinase-PPPase family)